MFLALIQPYRLTGRKAPTYVLTYCGFLPGVDCRPFKTPHAVVGHYECLRKRVRKSGQGETHACLLVCPPSMTTRPKRLRVIHRCHKGRWLVQNENVHCVGAWASCDSLFVFYCIALYCIALNVARGPKVSWYCFLLTFPFPYLSTHTHKHARTHARTYTRTRTHARTHAHTYIHTRHILN